MIREEEEPLSIRGVYTSKRALPEAGSGEPRQKERTWCAAGDDAAEVNRLGMLTALASEGSHEQIPTLQR